MKRNAIGIGQFTGHRRRVKMNNLGDPFPKVGPSKRPKPVQRIGRGTMARERARA